MNKLHLIVRDQFPDFVAEDYPLFVAFVEAYYKWMDEQSVGKLQDIADLDTTPEQFVQYFKTQLDASGLFNDVTPFNALYLQKIKEIYNSKGSQQALVNILRLTYNTETEISYPSEYILRASSGKWLQESFIVVELIQGSIPEGALDCYIKYEQYDLRLEISHTENISPTATRIYFKLRYGLSVNEGQIVYFYDTNKILQYSGRIVRSPVRLSVVNGGKNWQLGQVIIVPGTVTDTAARVSEITVDGAIVSVEILQYGYDHTENQILIVSPYPNKPLGSPYNLTTTQTSANPTKYLYTLTLNDYTDGATDTVRGINFGVTKESYVLGDYVETGYVGVVAFDNSTFEIANIGAVDSEFNIQQWLESRATLVYEYGTLITQRGKWLDESGALSNESIKLQDNFYYQQYSYDIQSYANPNKYTELASLLNPVGMKKFTTYNLGEIVLVEPEATTSFPLLKIDILDVLTIGEVDYKLVTKYPKDAVLITDFDKQTVTKNPSEILLTPDAYAKDVTKNISDLDVALISEFYTRILTKNFSEIRQVVDQTNKDYNKYVTDSATISSSDNSVYELMIYNTEGYFAETYSYTENYLTIGD